MNPTEKYRIIEQIGGPGKRKFARVYLCEEKRTGERVVLKSITKTDSNHHLQERLRKEAAFSFNLDGLPETRDVFESENEILVFKSFHTGIDLKDYIGQFRSKEKAKQLLEVLLAIAPLLNHIHQKQIYHLDLKPGNIIVDSSEKKIRVSLIDFGMALDKNNSDERKTLFPLGYAAPELLLNQLHLVDHRSDYFALGITAWTCLQDKMPLIHSNPSITTNLQLTYPLPELDSPFAPLSQVLQRMAAKQAFSLPPNQMNSKEVERVLTQGMNQRYPHFEDFLIDFEQQLACVKKTWRIFS